MTSFYTNDTSQLRLSVNFTPIANLHHEDAQLHFGCFGMVNRSRLFANAGGNVVQADRAALKAVNNGFAQFAVHHVKAARIQFPDTGESAILKILRKC
jgi:hypothetical protein